MYHMYEHTVGQFFCPQEGTLTERAFIFGQNVLLNLLKTVVLQKHRIHCVCYDSPVQEHSMKKLALAQIVGRTCLSDNKMRTNQMGTSVPCQRGHMGGTYALVPLTTALLFLYKPSMAGSILGRRQYI